MENMLEANLNNLHDEELMNLQNTKKRPSVIISEFVGGGDGDESSEDEDNIRKKDEKIHAKIEDVS